MNKNVFQKLLFMFMVLFAFSSSVNAIDYDNISFTNEEFLGTGIVDTSVVQINNTHIAIAYVKITVLDTYMKYCYINGTGCGSEITVETGSYQNSEALDIFFDNSTNLVHIITATPVEGSVKSFNLAGTLVSTLVYNVGDTAYVSAVQTNTTHFAIGYVDVANTNKGTMISCALDGSSCASEVILSGVATNTYNELILKSDGNLAWALNRGVASTSFLLFNLQNTALFPVDSSPVINPDTTEYIDMIEGSDNKLKIVYQDGGNANANTFITCDLDGTNCGSEVVWEATAYAHMKIIEDNNQRLFTINTFEKLYNFNLTGGDLKNTSIWTTNATTSNSIVVTSNNQILISYEDNTASKGMFAISESLPTTPAIVSNLTSYYNSLTNNISLTTTTNSNYSYVLNGASEISIKNETNSTSILLTGVEGLNNVTWISTDTNGQTNTSETFTIDVTNPSLTVTSGSTFTTFIINLTTIITYSDTNIDTCIVTIEGGTTNCNNESYTFSTSGLHNFNVTATDLAGNSNTSLNNNLTINPYHYFYFQNSSGSAITNFTVDGTSFTNYANFTTNSLGLGNHIFTFAKLGWGEFNYTRNINSSATYNETINVSQSTIVLRIYDADTGALLTGLTEITLIATTGYNSSTTTGLLNISNLNFISESYQIIASHTGYGTETVYFDYTNQEILNKDIYLLNLTEANYGTITLEVVDGSGQFIENAICKALEWVPSQSAYVSVAEGQTNIQGLTTLNVHLDIETYKFQCTKGGITATSNAQIIQTTGTTLPIELLYTATTTPSAVLSGFSYTLINTTVNATHQLITYTFDDEDNLVNTACLDVYQQTGTKKVSLATATCTSSSSGSVFVIIDINQTYTTVVQASVLVSGVTKNVDSLTFKGTGDISFSLGQYNLDILLPLLFVILGLLVGLVIKPQNIYISIISTIIMVWFAVVIVPTVISSSIAIFITFICVLMLYGGQKK